MHLPPESSEGPAEFYAVLWLVASGAAVDAIPDDLDELAAQLFTRFRPSAKT